MKQVIAVGLVVLIFLALMGLRLWAVLRNRAPADGAVDTNPLERWARHVTRGGDDQ